MSRMVFFYYNYTGFKVDMFILVSRKKNYCSEHNNILRNITQKLTYLYEAIKIKFGYK